jgi:thiosulfate reductase cytochrome b subunit
MEKILIQERHSSVLRWTHWLNIPFLFLMIWSGLLIYWANQSFIKLPEFINAQVHNRLAEGMSWHFFVMWPFVMNGLVYFFYLLLSGHWKEIIPGVKPLHESVYGHTQKVMYTSAIVFGVLAVVSGLAIYKPVQLEFLNEVMGGYNSARFIHFNSMILLSAFAFIHIVRVAFSGWTNIRSMMLGFVIEKK